MADEIPTKWLTMVVTYGEKKKRLCWDSENVSPAFHATEAEAQKWAEDHCRYWSSDVVLVLRADRLVRTKPLEFETMKVA